MSEENQNIENENQLQEQEKVEETVDETPQDIDDSKFVYQLNELDPNRPVTYRCKLRSKVTLLLFGVAAVLGIIFIQNLIVRIFLAVIILVPVIANFTLIKDRDLLELNNDEIIVFPIGKDYCFKFSWDDVQTYCFDSQSTSMGANFKITLNDNSVLYIPSNSSALMQQFMKHIPDKEQMQLFKMKRKDFKEKTDVTKFFKKKKSKEENKEENQENQ